MSDRGVSCATATRDVLCLIDSITRFATAQREIGLSTGKPPTTKGYTPTVFAELPKLLERAGPGTGKGTITGLFNVLVDGDDHNEPVAMPYARFSTATLCLIARLPTWRYPAINVLRSISRTMPACNSEEETRLIASSRMHLATYEDMAELVGWAPIASGVATREVDEAIHPYYPAARSLSDPAARTSAPTLASGYAAP